MPQEFDRLVEEVVIKRDDRRYSLQIKGTIYVRGMNIINTAKGLHWEPFTTEMGAWDTLDEARIAGQKYRSNEEESNYIEKIVLSVYL